MQQAAEAASQHNGTAPLAHASQEVAADNALIISEVLEDLVSAVEEGVTGDREAAAETEPAACDNGSVSAEGGNDAAPQPVAIEPSQPLRCKVCPPLIAVHY